MNDLLPRRLLLRALAASPDLFFVAVTEHSEDGALRWPDATTIS